MHNNEDKHTDFPDFHQLSFHEFPNPHPIELIENHLLRIVGQKPQGLIITGTVNRQSHVTLEGLHPATSDLEIMHVSSSKLLSKHHAISI